MRTLCTCQNKQRLCEPFARVRLPINVGASLGAEKPYISSFDAGKASLVRLVDENHDGVVTNRFNRLSQLQRPGDASTPPTQLTPHVLFEAIPELGGSSELSSTPKLAGCPADSNLACPTEGSARNETKSLTSSSTIRLHGFETTLDRASPSRTSPCDVRVNVGSARRRLGAGSPKRGEERVDADRCDTCPRRSTASRR
ncbi:hypothetical protein quinque_008787 [Culex quinquefasciatus]